MNEFEKIFNEMNLDRALLPILFRSNRSTVWKYLSGDSTAPASAMSLIMLLQLIQKRNPDLLAEWLTLSDFTIPPEVYLDQPDYWKGWVYTQHKVNKNVLEYLKNTIRMKTKKVWVKPQKSKLSLPAHMPDAHRLAVLVGMIIRVSVASGIGA